MSDYENKHRRLQRDMTDESTHYKMYKAGKMWLYSGITLLSFGLVALQNVSVQADTLPTTTSTTTNKDVLATSDSVALHTDAPNVATTTTDKTVTSGDNATSKATAEKTDAAAKTDLGTTYSVSQDKVTKQQGTSKAVTQTVNTPTEAAASKQVSSIKTVDSTTVPQNTVTPTSDQVTSADVAVSPAAINEKLKASKVTNDVALASISSQNLDLELAATTQDDIVSDAQSRSYQLGLLASSIDIKNMQTGLSNALLIGPAINLALGAISADANLGQLSAIFDALSKNGGSALNADGTLVWGQNNVPTQGYHLLTNVAGNSYTGSYFGFEFGHAIDNGVVDSQSSFQKGYGAGLQYIYNAWNNYIDQIKVNFTDKNKVNEFLGRPQTGYDPTQLTSSLTLAQLWSTMSQGVSSFFGSGLGTDPILKTNGTSAPNDGQSADSSSYSSIAATAKTMTNTVTFVIGTVIQPIISGIMNNALHSIGSMGLNQGGIDLPTSLYAAMNMNGTLKLMLDIVGMTDASKTSAATNIYYAIANGIVDQIVRLAKVGMDNQIKAKLNGTVDPLMSNYQSISGLNWQGLKDTDYANTKVSGQDQMVNLLYAIGAQYAARYDVPVINLAASDALAAVANPNAYIRSEEDLFNKLVADKVITADQLTTLNRTSSASVQAGDGSVGTYAPAGAFAKAHIWSLYQAESSAITKAVNDFKKDPDTIGTVPYWTNPSENVENATTIPMIAYTSTWNYLHKAAAEVLAMAKKDAIAQSHTDNNGNTAKLDPTYIPDKVQSLQIPSDIIADDVSGAITDVNNYQADLNVVVKSVYSAAYNNKVSQLNTAFAVGENEFDRQAATSSFKQYGVINKSAQVTTNNFTYTAKDYDDKEVDGRDMAYGQGLNKQQVAPVKIQLRSTDPDFSSATDKTDYVEYGVVGKSFTEYSPVVTGYIASPSKMTLAILGSDNTLTFNYTKLTNAGTASQTTTFVSDSGKQLAAPVTQTMQIGGNFNFAQPAVIPGYQVDLTKSTLTFAAGDPQKLSDLIAGVGFNSVTDYINGLNHDIVPETSANETYSLNYVYSQTAPTIKSVPELSIQQGDSNFNIAQLYTGGTNSEGVTIPYGALSVTGQVDVNTLGNYTVNFSYTDPITNAVSKTTSLVHVISTKPTDKWYQETTIYTQIDSQGNATEKGQIQKQLFPGNSGNFAGPDGTLVSKGYEVNFNQSSVTINDVNGPTTKSLADYIPAADAAKTTQEKLTDAISALNAATSATTETVGKGYSTVLHYVMTPVTPVLNTKGTINVPLNAVVADGDGLISVKNSMGEIGNVTANGLNVKKSVDTSKIGAAGQIVYNFVDPYTNQEVSATVFVNVVPVKQASMTLKQNTVTISMKQTITLADYVKEANDSSGNPVTAFDYAIGTTKLGPTYTGSLPGFNAPITISFVDNATGKTISQTLVVHTNTVQQATVTIHDDDTGATIGVPAELSGDNGTQIKYDAVVAGIDTTKLNVISVLDDNNNDQLGKVVNYDNDASQTQNFVIHVTHKHDINTDLKTTQTVKFVTPDGSVLADDVQKVQWQTDHDLYTDSTTYKPLNQTTLITPKKFEGYSANPGVINASSYGLTTEKPVNPDTITVHYIAAAASLIATYVDDDNNQASIGNAITVTGSTNSTGVFHALDKLPDGYHLADDQAKDINYSFGTDGTGNPITIHVKHNHDINSAAATTKFIVKYVGAPQVTPDNSQDIQWTSDTDEVTKTTVYTANTKTSPVTSPVYAGYTADQLTVDAQTLPATSTVPADTTKTVNYSGDIQHVSVKVIDTENGNELLQTLTIDGTSGKIVDFNAPDIQAVSQKLFAEGYQPVSLVAKDGKVYSFSDPAHMPVFDTDDNSLQEFTLNVIHNHEITHSTVTRTIHFIGGPTEQNAVDQNVDVTIDYDSHTKTTTYKASDNMPAYTAKTFPGYTATPGTVAEVNYDSLTSLPSNSDVYITYRADKADYTINFHDDETNTDLPAATIVLHGVTDGKGIYTPSLTGYKLAKNQADVINYTFSADPAQNSTTIHLIHDHVADTLKTTRTIYLDNSTLELAPIKQVVSWNVDEDKATGVTTYTPVDAGYPEYNIAVPTGFHVENSTVSATPLTTTTTTPTSYDVHVKVIGDDQRANMKLIDLDEDNKLLGSGYTLGTSGASIDFSTGDITDQINKLLSQGYVPYTITDNDTGKVYLLSDNADVTFDTDDAHNQNFTVSFNHSHQPGSASVEHVINYVKNGVTTTSTPITVEYTTDTDVVTKKVTYTLADGQTIADVVTPVIDGYTADISTVKANDYELVTDGKNSPQYVATVNYTANDQTLTVNYVDADKGDAFIVAKTVKGKTDGSATFNGEANLPTGYQLVNDTDKSITRTLSADASKNVVTIKVAHIINGSNDTTTRTIHYEGAKNNPADIKQTIHWDVATDAITGAKTYTLSKTGNDDVVTTPIIAGYKSNTDEVKASDAVHGQNTVTVTYTAQPATITIKFVDDDKGGSVLSNGIPQTGVTDQSTSYTLKDSDLPKGYQLATGVSHDVTLNFTADPAQTVEVHVTHVHTVTSGIKTTQTVHYVVPAGVTAPADSSQIVTWTKNVDEADGTTTYTPDEATVPAVISPVVAGYSPDQATVTVVLKALTNAPQNGETTVTYSKNQVATVTIHDDTDNSDLKSETDNGASGSSVVVSDDFNDALADYLAKGYQLVNIVDNTGKVVQLGDLQFDSDSNANQTFTVHLVHKTTTNTNAATSEAIVHYVGNNGETVAPDATEAITWTSVTDQVNGKVVYTPNMQPKVVVSPTIKGATADQGTVAQTLTTITSTKDKPVTPGNSEVTVHYNFNTGNSNSGENNTGDSNSGNSNSGSNNTGDSNVGNSNSGSDNHGDSNTGNSNSGSNNHGDSNSGNSNSGSNNTGDSNVGNSNSGSDNHGDSNTGNSNSGSNNHGDSNSGNSNSGSNNTGDSNTGNSNSGSNNHGDSNTGNSNSGSNNHGDSNSGNSNSGSNNTGDSNVGNSNSGSNNHGDSNTGSNNTGDSNTGNSNSGSNNHGDSNTGNSNSGSNNTGDSNVGNSNSGSNNHGDSNVGNSNSGSNNHGDSNSGNSNSGSNNTGDSNVGNSNSGSNNHGDSNTGNSNSGSNNHGDSNTGSSNSGSNNNGDGNHGNSNSGSNNTGDSNVGNSNSGSDNHGDSNVGNSNSGSNNHGDSNSGNSNSGSNNTGDSNVGNSNSGSNNHGDSNTGSNNTGDGNHGNSNSGSNNTGDSNVGNSNSGSNNHGDSNTGSNNTGDGNHGNSNSGSNNTGDSNVGNSNSGSNNHGDSNTGNSNSGSNNNGSNNTGDSNTGSSNSGSNNNGDGNHGNSNSGSNNTGDSNVGNSNSGSDNHGDSNVGNSNSGSNNHGDSNSGNSNSGSNNTGDSNVGSSNSGSNNHGDSNTGNSNSGSNNHGDSNSGNSNSGSNNTGDSNVGNSNSGSNNHGDSNVGNSNSGSNNHGDSNSGNSNSGLNNTGDSNVGNSNSGSNNHGDSNTGSNNTGDSNTGNSNSGSNNHGDSNTGNSNSGSNNNGSNNTGDSNTGSSNSGSNNSGDGNHGDSNSGNSNSGSNNTGDSNVGNSNSGSNNNGSNNTGDSNTGSSNSGSNNNGDGNHGNSNSGSNNTGDNNVGNSNSGSNNTGDSNVGNSNSGSNNTGDNNIGNNNVGHNNHGDGNVGDGNVGNNLHGNDLVNPTLDTKPVAVPATQWTPNLNVMKYISNKNVEYNLSGVFNQTHFTSLKEALAAANAVPATTAISAMAGLELLEASDVPAPTPSSKAPIYVDVTKAGKFDDDIPDGYIEYIFHGDQTVPGTYTVDYAIGSTADGSGSRKIVTQTVVIGNSNTGNSNSGNNNTGDSNSGNSNSGSNNHGDSNSGNSNSGSNNTGDSNTGNSNSGSNNHGDSNSGNSNSGSNNTGDSNTGNSNSGSNNHGDSNSGNSNSGSNNHGDSNSGNSNSGSNNHGDSNSGNSNSGSNNTGDSNTGNSNSGSNNHGDSNSGNSNSGSNNTGDSNSGNSNSGSNNTGDSNTGNSNSGSNNHGDSNSGNSNSGSNNTGDSNTGNSNSGSNNHGDSNSGNSNSGSNNHGDSNSGNSNSGSNNHGDSNSGNSNSGSNNTGDSNVGNSNSGSNNHGDSNTGNSNSGNSNSGNSNSGSNNTGDSNTGNSNSGSNNHGDSNSGNSNSGSNNTGDSNTGNSNSGSDNHGDSNSGNSNSGSNNTGDSNTGNSNSGSNNTGDSNVGNSNSGSNNTGDSNVGNSNSGSNNTGDSNTGNSNSGNSNSGNSNSGSNNTGDSNTGNSNSGSNNHGDSNSGNSNSGSNNTGDSNTGNSNSGSNNHGDSNSGNSNSGSNNHGDSNSGNSNSGSNNHGDSNSGNSNSGSNNHGDSNSGNSNSGSNNTGDSNVGNSNSGSNNHGDSNTGNSNSGNSNSGNSNSGSNNTGDSNTGNSNSGSNNHGDSNSGNSNSGSNNAGDSNTGNSNSGSNNHGDSNSGNSNSGSNNTGDSNTGNSNSGSNNTGDSNTGNSNSGSNNTGDSNTGNSNSGSNNTGDSNSGNSNSGSNNTGDSNTGNSNSGSNNHGDSNTGNSNSGSNNHGDSNSGNSNSGSNNTGDSNVGNSNSGSNNHGDSNTGNSNSGNSNSGNSNSGSNNIGDSNTGNSNSGSNNHGDSNSGNSNSGSNNTGDSNTGNSNSGSNNHGDSNTGNSNSGSNNHGDSNSGNSNSGSNNTGDSNTGNSNSGSNNHGDSNTGNSNSGSNNTGDSNTGNSNSGSNNHGDSNSGNSNSGSNNHGDSNTGNSNSGSNNHGDSNSGNSNSGSNNNGSNNTGDSNVGNSNSGSNNHGDSNSGNSNSGSNNHGDSNSGNSNSGSNNTGDSNVGNSNSGSNNHGDSNVGNSNSGSNNHGDSNTGNSNSGSNNHGDSNSGNSNSGSNNTGDSNTGNSNSGANNHGDSNSGNSNSGSNNHGDSNSGDSNSGSNNTGDSNTGNSNSGSNNHGDSNSGNSNSGSNNHGDSNSGNSNSGSNNTGDSNTGNSNSGSNNTGDSNVGNSNSGSNNHGDSNTGNSNSGSNNHGDSNSGNSNSGSNNHGNSNSGLNNTGDNNHGNSNSGSNNIGDGNYGNSNSGSNNTGDNNHGNSNSGSNNTGDNNYGNSNSGSNNTGDSNVGNSNSGSNNHGDNNIGNSNSGSNNHGDGNVGDGNVGNNNVGNNNHGDNLVGDGLYNPVIKVHDVTDPVEGWTAGQTVDSITDDHQKNVDLKGVTFVDRSKEGTFSETIPANTVEYIFRGDSKVPGSYTVEYAYGDTKKGKGDQVHAIAKVTIVAAPPVVNPGDSNSGSSNSGSNNTSDINHPRPSNSGSNSSSNNPHGHGHSHTGSNSGSNNPGHNGPSASEFGNVAGLHGTNNNAGQNKTELPQTGENNNEGEALLGLSGLLIGLGSLLGFRKRHEK